MSVSELLSEGLILLFFLPLYIVTMKNRYMCAGGSKAFPLSSRDRQRPNGIRERE